MASKPTLTAVGDIKIDKPIIKKLDQNVLSTINNSLFLVGNLEGPITLRGFPQEKLVNIRMNPELKGELKKLGLKLVCLANNHIMDYGPEGLIDTINILDELGIHRVGAGMSIGEALKPCIVKIENITLSFLAFSSTLPPNFAATRERPGAAPARVKTSYYYEPTWLAEEPGIPFLAETHVIEEDKKTIGKTIKLAKEKSDLCVCLFHWGLGISPFHFQLLDYQEELAHYAVECGCDVVIGGHPHVIQPVETYNGKPIFYSLGNFIFHQEYLSESMSPFGAILELYLNKEEVERVEMLFVKLDENGNPALLSEMESKTLIESLNLTSKLNREKVEIKNGRMVISTS